MQRRYITRSYIILYKQASISIKCNEIIHDLQSLKNNNYINNEDSVVKQNVFKE